MGIVQRENMHGGCEARPSVALSGGEAAVLLGAMPEIDQLKLIRFSQGSKTSDKNSANYVINAPLCTFSNRTTV